MDDVGKTFRTRPCTYGDLSKIVFPIVHRDSRIPNLKLFTLSKSVSLIDSKTKKGRTCWSKGPHCVLLR